jgi:hypothetical protein
VALTIGERHTVILPRFLDLAYAFFTYRQFLTQVGKRGAFLSGAKNMRFSRGWRV